MWTGLFCWCCGIINPNPLFISWIIMPWSKRKFSNYFFLNRHANVCCSWLEYELRENRMELYSHGLEQWPTFTGASLWARPLSKNSTCIFYVVPLQSFEVSTLATLFHRWRKRCSEVFGASLLKSALQARTLARNWVGSFEAEAHELLWISTSSRHSYYIHRYLANSLREQEGL